ncbi:hypothetical protein [Chitinophaga ginsengisegetis]|uniref:hypothetical protein n=1 Tax=Chitinophaga ginsengisegetis TaxID=393003 RepID=UPI000DBA2B0F|nr:hypothetical protein [Chitinophaga ginsengisegetis]MDR6566100.1 hypothetical protein [Chitinophaga ginsengisegetis]MDR6645830.1 hypothetical protein [Chitinophaga ginsengisegetis]MDR6651578.1 hypothetical protein [Chitinophaga ginsengisegetis]
MTVTSINALKSLSTPQANTIYHVLGYYAANDGGGGEFYWDSSDTTSPENGGTIFIASTGRWKRLYDGELNVKWFGAKGTPDAIDDAPAINKCLDYARQVFTNGGKLVFPRGRYPISSTLNMTNAIFWQIIGEGATIAPTSAITAINIKASRSTYTGLNISYETLDPGVKINENCVAIWLHKGGSTVNDQVNNTTFECFSIIGAHTGIKSTPNTGLIWQLDFKSIYFDIYEGESSIQAIGFDIASGFNQGGSTTIRISKCCVQSFIVNRLNSSGEPIYPKGVGYRGFRIYYSTDVYIVDSSYDGYLSDTIQLNQNGQIMDIFSKNIHIDGFHCEALTNTLNANITQAPFRINSTGFLDIKNVVILDSFMNCGGPTAAGAWFLFFGGGVFNFGTYNDNHIGSADNTPVYIITLSNLLDGDDVTNKRSQINLSNSIQPSQVHLLNRNYNSIRFDAMEVNGLVTAVTGTAPVTILTIPTTRASCMIAVRGFSQIDGSSYFIDYLVISRSRTSGIVKIKSLLSDNNSYASVVNTYSVTSDGNIQLARNISTGFWVTAKVVNMI